VRRGLFQDIVAEFALIKTETMINIRVDGNPSQIRTLYLPNAHQEFIKHTPDVKKRDELKIL